MKVSSKLLLAAAAIVALSAAVVRATSPFTQTQWIWGVTSAMTGTTSTQVVALVTGKSLYITSLQCNNTSTTVNTLVTIQDGSGGTTLDTVAASDNFGGTVQSGGVLFVTTNGNALYAADVTTGASVICSASGYAN